jgi:hypothetical protein
MQMGMVMGGKEEEDGSSSAGVSAGSNSTQRCEYVLYDTPDANFHTTRIEEVLFYSFQVLASHILFLY